MDNANSVAQAWYIRMHNAEFKHGCSCFKAGFTCATPYTLQILDRAQAVPRDSLLMMNSLLLSSFDPQDWIHHSFPWLFAQLLKKGLSIFQYALVLNHKAQRGHRQWDQMQHGCERKCNPHKNLNDKNQPSSGNIKLYSCYWPWISGINSSWNNLVQQIWAQVDNKCTVCDGNP